VNFEPCYSRALLPDGPADANGGFQCAVLCSVLFNLAADQQGTKGTTCSSQFDTKDTKALQMNSDELY